MINDKQFNKGKKIEISESKMRELLEDIAAAAYGTQAGLELIELVRIKRRKDLKPAVKNLMQARKLCWQTENALLAQLEREKPDPEKTRELHAKLSLILYAQQEIIEKIKKSFGDRNTKEIRAKISESVVE